MANKLELLNSLSKQVPAMNKKAAGQLESARALGQKQQLKQAAGAMEAGQISPEAGAAGVSQQMGAQAAGTMGQQRQQQLAQQQAQMQQAAQQSLKQREAVYQKTLVAMADKQAQSVEAQKQHMFSLGKGIKEQLFDAQMQFAESERGRKFRNERQLMDHVLLTEKASQKAQDRLQYIQQVGQQRIQVLEGLYKRLNMIMKQGWVSKEQKLNAKHKKALKSYANEIKAEIAKKKSAFGAKAQFVKGALTVAGAGAGLATGTGPAGVMVGAQAGSAAGDVAVSQM